MTKSTKIISFLLSFLFLLQQPGIAQSAGTLDISGKVNALRGSFMQDKFRPLHLRSLGFDNSQNNFNLFLESGDSADTGDLKLADATKTLLNYFFIGIVLPNDAFWVNLRPDSENNIIDPDLGMTDVGKILLEADLNLKKDTARYTSPETPEGREYWNKLYNKAGEIFGSQNITVPTLTRPWIVPGEIIIRETEDNAYIYKATLKVMLEQDYLKNSVVYKFDDQRSKALNEYSSQLIRELILPKLTREINTSLRYTSLRQVYYSLILAQWFKSRLHGKSGLYSRIIDRRDLRGLISKTPWTKTAYFKAYQSSFKDGEYNIKQPSSTPYGQVIRNYFSGGFVCNITMPAVPAAGSATERTDGVTKVTAISGAAQHYPLSQKRQVIDVLAAGRNMTDPSEIEVVIKPAVNLAGHSDFGAQVSDVKNLSRLLRLLNVLRRSEKVPEITEDAADRDIMDFCMRYLEKKRLIIKRTDAAGNIVVAISNNAVNYPDEAVRGIVEAMQKWVVSPQDGVKAINFQNKEGDWVIVGFDAELQDEDILRHEQREIEYRRQGLSWRDAHNRTVNEMRDRLSLGSYERFAGWLNSIPAESLENTVLIFNLADELLRGLSNSREDFGLNNDVLSSLVDKGFFSREEMLRAVEEKKVLEKLLLGLDSPDDYMCFSSAKVLKSFTDVGLISREEAAKEIKKKKVLEGLVLSPFSGYTRENRFQTLKTLIEAGLISSQEARALIKENKVFESVLSGLDIPGNTRKASARMLRELNEAGLILKEEIKEKDILEILLSGLSNNRDFARVECLKALKALIDSGLVSREEAVKVMREKKPWGVLLIDLNSRSVDSSEISSEMFKIIFEAGIISREDVKEIMILDALVYCIRNSYAGARSASAQALKALIDSGLVSREEAIIKIKEYRVFEILLSGLIDPYGDVRMANPQALKSFIEASLISGEEARMALEALLPCLKDSFGGARTANAQLLKALIDSGLVSREEAARLIKKKKVLESLLPGLKDPRAAIRKSNFDVLNVFVYANLIPRGAVKREELLTFLLRGLNDLDKPDRERNLMAIRALINSGLVAKEEEWKTSFNAMLREVRKRDSTISDYYLLKMFFILRDDPASAYKVFNWSREELTELFHISDYLIKGMGLDFKHKVKPGDEYALERQLIGSGLPLLDNPKAFIVHLKRKLKAAISDPSVKLAIRVYEIASVNAARGLIKELGLGRDNVIVLYDREINYEQAEKFFPGYEVREFSKFADKKAVKIEFHDSGRMKIDTSDRVIKAFLCYTPFKFNLPERSSEGELERMKEALGAADRKIIVIGSPSDEEFGRFIQDYNTLYASLPFAKRPLLIVGFRQRRDVGELKLLGSLSGQSIAVRSDANAPLPNVAGNNVLILNTSGELLKMYSLADVAIVGNDRNIFEPASQRTAILYFEGSWQNNSEAKNALVEAGAAKEFNRDNLEGLMDNPEESMQSAERGLEAVRAYRQEVQSKAEEFSSQIIGVSEKLRNKLVSAPLDVALNAPEALSPSIGTPIRDFGNPDAQIPDVFRQEETPALISDTDKKGGIDFRALPIINQPINAEIVKLNPVVLSRLNSINLDAEWAQIKDMVEAGIIHSSERMKEYVLASYSQQCLGGQMDKVLGCIADILRMEEDRAVDTDLKLTGLLVLIEASKPGSAPDSGK